MKPYIHKVNYYETDKMQVTHHSNYIRFMEEARVDFLEQLGWGYDKMEAEGVVSPVISVTCDYKRPTTFPDVISIAVTVASCTSVKLTLSYIMKVNDTVVCKGTSSHCFLGKDGKPLFIKDAYPELYRILIESTPPTHKHRYVPFAHESA